MKKIYLSVIAAGFVLGANAQKAANSQVFKQNPFATSFETNKGETNVPKLGAPIYTNDFTNAGDWTIDNDGATGATFGWGIGATENSWFFSSVLNSTSDGNFASVNNGVVNPAVNAEIGVTYTLTTAAPIDVNALSGGSNNYVIEFQQYGARFNDAQEVYISTDGTNFTLVGDNSDKDQLTASGGAPYANPTVEQINLSGALPGGTNSLWIRFSWTSAYPGETNPNAWVTYGWMIDDVKIYVADPNDLKMNKVFAQDVFNLFNYSKIPNEQSISEVVGAVISNEGGLPQTKTYAVEIKEGSNVVYTGNSASFTINPGVTDTVWFDTGFTPTTIGNYTVTLTLPADDASTNNAGTETYEITDHLYAHNYTLGAGVLSFDDEVEVGIGNQFIMANDQLLKGIDVNFGTGTTAGMFVTVYVFEVVAGSIQDAGNIDVVNFDYQIPTPVSTSAVTSIVLPTPYTLEAGKHYFAMIKGFQSSSEKFAIKNSDKGDEDYSTVCYGPFGTGNAVNYFNGWGSAPALALNFNPVLSVNENNSNVSLSEVYPNPTSGETTIKFELANAENVNVVVLDQAGRVVKNVANGLQVAGKHAINFNADDLKAGVYFVNIISNNSTVTQKFVKK